MKKFILSAVLIFTFTQTAHAELKKWNKKMQGLGDTFAELLPDLADSSPLDAKTRARLEKGSKKLATLAHSITMVKGALPPDADPTLPFVAARFDKEVKRASHAIQNGNYEYGKALLRNISGYCITCHTRNEQGPEFPKFEVNPKTANLSPVQRAEMFSALRQFDSSLEIYEKMVADKELAAQDQFTWGKALRRGLNLAVRVKKDPDRALALVNTALALPQTPGFFARYLPIWKKSVTEWKSEANKKFETEEALFEEAQRLSADGRALQEFSLDSSGDVLYLRSSATAHELLGRFPKGKRTADALLLEGKAYDLLEERMNAPLANFYYEACIRHSPHTTVAQQCFERFESNLLFGYSGSAGTFIPKDLKDLSDELSKLASKKH